MTVKTMTQPPASIVFGGDRGQFGVPYWPLDSDENFQKIAREVDDGWSVIVSKAAVLDTSVGTGRKSLFTDAELAERFLNGDEEDLRALATVAVDFKHEAEILERISRITTAARGALVQEHAIPWLREHVTELTARIQTQRKRIAEGLRKVTPSLEVLETVDSLAGHPEAAQAFSKATRLLGEWDSWTATHRSLVADERLLSRWPGLDYIGRYTEAWPEFYNAREWQAEIDGVPTPMTPRKGTPAPWSGLDALGKIRHLSQITPWTPTGAELARAADDLDRELLAAHRRVSQEANTERARHNASGRTAA